jgi:hypothetical protein
MKIYDVVYAQQQNGDKEKTQKTQWIRLGVLLEKEDGKMRIKLDAIPTGNWDGWLNVFERQEKKE